MSRRTPRSETSAELSTFVADPYAHLVAALTPEHTAMWVPDQSRKDRRAEYDAAKYRLSKGK